MFVACDPSYKTLKMSRVENVIDFVEDNRPQNDQKYTTACRHFASGCKTFGHQVNVYMCILEINEICWLICWQD